MISCLSAGTTLELDAEAVVLHEGDENTGDSVLQDLWRPLDLVVLVTLELLAGGGGASQQEISCIFVKILNRWPVQPRQLGLLHVLEQSGIQL